MLTLSPNFSMKVERNAPHDEMEHVKRKENQSLALSSKVWINNFICTSSWAISMSPIKSPNNLTWWLAESKWFPLNLGKFFLISYGTIFGKPWIPSKHNDMYLLVEIDQQICINGLHTWWNELWYSFNFKIYSPKLIFRFITCKKSKQLSTNSFFKHTSKHLPTCWNSF